MWATIKLNKKGVRKMTNINLNKHLLVKAHPERWAIKKTKIKTKRSRKYE